MLVTICIIATWIVVLAPRRWFDKAARMMGR